MKKPIFIAIAAFAAGALGYQLYAHWGSVDVVSTAQAATVTQISTSPVADKKGMITTLPDVSLPNKDGQKQSVRSWTGKSMIVNFWATWCGPCRKEIPLLKEIAKAEAPNGFQVVGIAIDYRDDVLKYANEIKMDYPILIGEDDGLKAAEAFGVDTGGLPFTVFSDQKGRIVMTLIGELNRAKADVILNNVKRVNKGELTPEQARATIASKLQGMGTA